jgi:dTDP-4-amino-4,6-dideoxygalactose transaminase
MFCIVLASLWTTFDISYCLPKISGMVFGVGVFFAVAREAEHLHSKNLIRFSGGRKFNALQSGINYSPLHRFFIYAAEWQGRTSFLPNTDENVAREVTIPLYPTMCDE